MIVVDTNILASLFLPTDVSEDCHALLRGNPFWLAPPLWRDELCNALALQVRNRKLSVSTAADILHRAHIRLGSHVRQVPAREVLMLAAESGCTAYDCEFVALAKSLGVPLATCDQKLLAAFPLIARDPRMIPPTESL
jgi:predicted nucleic acid-binding protein